MREWTWKTAVVAVLFAMAAGAALRAQQATADLVLVNGKIVTVDDRFTLAEAVAIRGDRFVAVGTTEAITRLAGPATRRIDLQGRAVIPGLIDHHGHYLRAGSTWLEEDRWDGIESRAAALEKLHARASREGPGVWLYNQMGWSLDQFTDDRTPFTREELDRLFPDNPVFLQEQHYRIYLNSPALQALGIAETPPDPDWVPGGSVERDAGGRPTGVILQEGVRPAASRFLELPVPRSRETIEAGHRAMIQELNRVGLTAIGSTNCEGGLAPWIKETYRRWASQGELNIRVFCQTSVPTGRTPEEVDRALPLIAQIKLFQGDAYLDDVNYGEGLYGPASDDMLHVTPNQRPEDFEQWGRLAREIARAGLPLHVHTTLEATFDGFLDQIEAINREYPIRTLRWATYHSDQINQSHLDRMKRLGMYVGVHMRPVTIGGIFHSIRGARAYDNPPLRLIQDSGIMWGIGTDFNLGPYNPFLTLRYVVTGRMVGGRVVNRQPIDREDALIAHTRRNAFFIFQENNLGSIQPGKLADLVVLDRDYLTVPADEINDIKPVLTMVGGRVVYEAAQELSSQASGGM